MGCNKYQPLYNEGEEVRIQKRTSHEGVNCHLKWQNCYGSSLTTSRNCFFNNDSYGFENLDGFSLFKLCQP